MQLKDGTKKIRRKLKNNSFLSYFKKRQRNEYDYILKMQELETGDDEELMEWRLGAEKRNRGILQILHMHYYL